MNTDSPLIVGIGGTMRVGSTSEKAMAAALRMAESRGARTLMLSGPALDMETFDPAVASRSENAQRLVEVLRAADGIILSSPSYHGTISGHLKNALDYTEDMRADERPYFDNRAVGCIVCADGAQAMGSTLSTLRSIVHALRGWPTPYAAVINSSLKPFEADGSIKNPDVAAQLNIMAGQVVEFARRARLAASVEASVN
ncbi:MAG: NAD(P)H-dependent oxidoreductase [Pusillimonas sp.]|nr:NAD(P)H-dependent oxidoreductase [Pusillimonas sp.]